LLTHLYPPSGVYPVRFDRYSPYFMKAKEYGLDLHPLDYYSLIYPFPAEALNDLAYYFADVNIGAEYAQTVSQWIGKIREKIDCWHEVWKSHDDHPVLLLYKHGDQHMIRDSRSGELKEYPITAVSARILNLMADTKRIGDVNKEFTNGSSIDAAKEPLIAPDCS
jgi:magnesium-protoporphyrin IX monomethyl ester (oxidative) cyclase